MRVFFDASVIIASFLFPTGGSSLLLQYVRKGRIVGVTSQTVVDEVVNNSEKLRKTHTEILDFIASSKIIVRDEIAFEQIQEYQGLIDEKDAHLIAGAVLTKCSHLVSLDKKHVVNETNKVRFPLKIIFPKDLLEEIIE